MIQARAPHGTHHAFEPVPHLASRLCERFPAVAVHQVALADAPGTVEFTVVDGALDVYAVHYALATRGWSAGKRLTRYPEYVRFRRIVGVRGARVSEPEAQRWHG
jgi:hypothetical protein